MNENIDAITANEIIQKTLSRRSKSFKLILVTFLKNRLWLIYINVMRRS